MKRLLIVIVALLVLMPLMVIGYQILHEPGRDATAPAPADPNAQIARGAYLARAGNCIGCHTAKGGAAFAGGRAIPTPFGNIYASNITPDAQTGLGNWSADDFWRALHNGKSRDGSFLYPAFPYPNYTKVTREDADAIFAYLRSLTPVRQKNRSHELRFPYNQRLLLAFWRTLYFTPGQYRPESTQTAEWNRGAYLVQGLGHCSACHTTRNALGGTSARNELAGGLIPMLNWYASPLTSGADSGLGDWQQKDLVELLHTGVSQRGAVFGPMAEVVAGSLQHLEAADIHAMATYLKSVPSSGAPTLPSAVRTDQEPTAVLALGARLYENHCAACHQANGKGAPPAYPPLAGNAALSVQPAVNAIRIVLNGGYPPSTRGNPRPYGMPPFGFAFNDQEVAAVVSYIRMSWDNKGGLVSPVEVARLRSTPAE